MILNINICIDRNKGAHQISGESFNKERNYYFNYKILLTQDKHSNLQKPVKNIQEFKFNIIIIFAMSNISCQRWSARVNPRPCRMQILFSRQFDALKLLNKATLKPAHRCQALCHPWLDSVSSL